jgi:hypothetical protein
MPARAESLLVDVGGVDLDAVSELLVAERRREHHRNCVRLLARRAAGRPGTDRRTRRLGGKDPRNHLVRDELPRRCVAEERRDVDQDRVEELDELVRVRFEVAAVLGVVVQPESLHALRHAPHQARPLVALEVEAALALYEVEELLELRGRRRLRPGHG